MLSLKDDLDIWKHRCDFIQRQTLTILKHSYYVTSVSCKRPSSSYTLLLSLSSLSSSSSSNLYNSTLLPISQTVWLDVIISLYRLTKDLESLSRQINMINIYEMQKCSTITSNSSITTTYKCIFNKKNTGDKDPTFLIPFLLVITTITTILMMITFYL